VTVTLQGATATSFNAAGAPVTFHLSCPTLQVGADTVAVYDNGDPVPFETLAASADAVTLPSGVASGRHELKLVAQDIYGFTIEHAVVIWAGTFSVPVRVLNEAGAPEAGATVVAKLADDPAVSASLVTDAAGGGTFSNLPNRSYNVIATASGNRTATQPTSVFDGTVVLRLRGFKASSPIDNNDFSQGTAGWDVGTAPVAIIPHVEELTAAPLRASLDSGARSRRPDPDKIPPASAHEKAAALELPLGTDMDLELGTAGEGQQSVSRTFDVEEGVKSVVVRYRFITSEVPGGYFGTEFNDFFNVSIRTLQGGGAVTDGNSMNGLGLAAFDGGGATRWFETELEVRPEGDTVQVDVAVANVADGLFDSQVVVDLVKKKKLTISQLLLNDIDNTRLGFLSASAHTYFGGNTRVHGTITIKGPKEDSLEELKLEVLEGGVIATGPLATALAGTLYRAFGDPEEIAVQTSQLLFPVPAAQLAAASQGTNGAVTLRVKARSSSGETAEKEFGSVTKLALFQGTDRYGGRDAGVGGDDWAKPQVRSFVEGAGLTWGDFSNMNGGNFPPHQAHRTGNSADGWVAGYNARNAATAATIVGHLNTHGRRITAVYVTFTPTSTFAAAIASVTLTDGRRARDVIRNVGGHTTHFHWEVSDN
jgi:hypothetical protein